MSKSYEVYVLGLYEAIITDCQVRYPHLRKDFIRDLSRLSSCVEARGLSFLMIDLVDFGKHFDKCLSNQRLIPSSLAYQKPFKKGTAIPRLFKGLLLRVFNINGVLRHDYDRNAITCLRQLYFAAKKIRLECSDERRDKCVKSFYEIERDIRRGSQEWEYDDPCWDFLDSVDLRQRQDPFRNLSLPLFEEEVKGCQPVDDKLLLSIHGVADIVSSILGVFNPLDWKTKHGPGAVSDSPAGVSKYSFPYWPQKLERVFPYADFAFANYNTWASHVSSEVAQTSESEPPSRLIMVPKTLKSPRLIASEPISHQWCQQAIKDYFTGRVSDTFLGDFISFRDQVPNQVMARDGSIDGSLSTIDLSEASDRLSLWLIERVFRRNKSLIDALQAARTRSITNDTGHGPQGVSKLHKFSCMGSACTFPVQTVVFLIIALGVVLYETNTPVTIKSIKSLRGQVRTFGDDIIVPTGSADRVMDTLAFLGLKVNHSKTFRTGLFRESCGLDVYEGTNVTPVYSMTYPSSPKPESIASVVETHNNFLERGWYSVSDYIASTVRRECSSIRNVPLGSGCFGLATIGYPDNSHLKRRVNRNTQVLEIFPTLVSTRARKTRDLADSMLLQYFTEAPSPENLWEAGIAQRPTLYLKRRWVDASTDTY